MSVTDLSPEMRSARIRELNDRFRQTFIGGAVVTTPGVLALGRHDVAAILKRVREFDEFTEENDPYGEHDFLSFAYGEHTIFAKLDYYDRAMEQGSEDPADPEKTTRVLTILLAEEY